MMQAARCFVLSGAIVGLLAWSAPATGQPAEAVSSNPTTAPPSYTHRAWTTEDGLPQNSASALVQTRDGYLWVGTYQGLARFDGSRFTIYDGRNTPAMTSDWIDRLLADRRGGLWVATQKEILRYDGESNPVRTLAFHRFDFAPRVSLIRWPSTTSLTLQLR